MSIECAALDIPTGNLKPILHEIAHSLGRWLNEGTEHSIDLRAMPMSNAEVAQLVDALGQGEVKVTLEVLGDTEIIETRYSGVWLVTHFNEDHSAQTRTIEITDVPALLKTQRADAVYGLQQLHESLEEQP